MTSSTIHYSKLTLDRASGRRSDPAWIATLLAEPKTQVIPLWRDHCLVRDGAVVTLLGDKARQVLDAATDSVLLGLNDGVAVFATDLSGLDQVAAIELADAETVLDVRSLVTTLTKADAGMLAYARGILHWNRNQQFCGLCGGRSETHEAGHMRKCLNCGKLLFPRIEPAVIMLVEAPGDSGRCLLGRHQGAAADSFSTLAGFVEIGESLEDTVRREVAEEAGVIVDEVSYQGSQAWPFPAGLMVGFRAKAVSDDIGVDGAELLDARWFTTADVRAHIAASAPGGPYRVDSIGKFLIESWLSEND